MNANPLNSPRQTLTRSARILLALLCGMPGFSRAAEPRAALTGHIPAQMASATLVTRASANEPIQLSLVVKLDQNLLDSTVAALYGRQASAQRQFLSSAEFSQKFGLADKRLQLKNFARANGLAVGPDDGDQSMVVTVSGPASAIEQAFNVRLNHYQASDGSLFRSNDSEPMIPASLTPHLGAIMGLNNISASGIRIFKDSGDRQYLFVAIAQRHHQPDRGIISQRYQGRVRLNRHVHDRVRADPRLI